MAAKRSSVNCNCQSCRHNLDFDLPKRLVDEIAQGNVVLFAGAGICTEAEGVYPCSLYDEIRDEFYKGQILPFDI